MKLFSSLLLLLLLQLTSFSQDKIAALLIQLNTGQSDTTKVWNFQEVSTYYQYSKPDSAIYFAGEGLELARKLKYRLGEGLMIGQLGTIHEKHGNLNLAKELSQEALSIYEKLNFYKGMAAENNALGVIEGKKGNYNIATRHFFKALELNEKIKNKIGIVQTYIKIGTVNDLTGNLKEALRYYLRANDLNKTIPNSNATFTLLNNIGIINAKKGNLKKALEYFLKGISLSNSPRYAGDHVALLGSAGTAYRFLGEHSKALLYQKEVIKKAKEYHLPDEESRALINLAALDKNSGLTHLTKALKISKAIENKELEAEINKEIGLLFKKQKKYQEALSYFEEHHELKDSLLNIEKQTEIKSLESTYHLGKTKEQLERVSLLHETRTLQRNASILAGVGFFVLLLVLGIYLIKTRKLNKQLLTKEKQLKLLNEQLKEKTNLANKQNKAKSEFLANMSHEIRTPMNGVIGMANLLMISNLSDEQTEFVHSIRISAESLLNIINDILDFSKIESGKLELEESPFFIHQVIEETYDLLSVKANEKNIDLLYIIDHDVPMEVLGDITRVRQILINLVGNAVKFTKEGEILTQVKLAERNDLWYELQFSVSDTGIGIPTNKLNKLFQSFSQVDSSTTRKYGGTGLGLAICARLTELMHGRIWAKSTVNEGTSFFFTIKVKALADKGALKTHSNDTFIHGKKALIVDDNETNLLILKAACEEWGLQADTFSDAEQALKTFQDQSYDLAIIDEFMPGMKGIDLAKRMKEISTRNVPLILLSSVEGQIKASDEIRSLFVSALDKPIKRENFRKTVIERLSEKNPSNILAYTLDRRTGVLDTEPIQVLIAEDNVINQKIVSKALENMGHTFDIVSNGLEVITALKNQKYDLILMDIQMDEMDGIETTQKIISKYGDQRPYIIALTASAFEKDRQQCLDAGMDDYISKPFTLDNFYNKITHFITEKDLQ